ncbi:MAG: peptidase MA family metallohydrolase, partial [Fidelibacterota bacterium]
MKLKSFYIIFLVLLISFPGVIYPQLFGKNKVQYRDFNWSYIQSPHFDIYFYDGGKELAEIAADIAESSYVKISEILRYRLGKRISIIIYNSHNDFQQTNVILEYLTEGIGGFTEIFKNRVVLPFEGSYKQFKHVLHHELIHAVINDMIYGGSVQSIITGQVRLQIPLWLGEGFAEFSSSYWDTKADMVMRDLSIEKDIPEINHLYGYLAYKGGQSVMKYISEKYGEEKIGEIFRRIKGTRSVENGFRASIGQDLEELSKKWQKYLKKSYWPDIANRSEPGEFALRLTDHTEVGNFMNLSPAISPGGAKIAFLSDKSGYADIYLMSSVDGKIISKVISGQRTPDFEELKWLSPRISWSPDGKKITFTAKSGKSDVLFIVDVKSGEKRRYELGFDGLFTAAWSPTGQEIAFMGTRSNRSDIYIFDIEKESVRNITDDVFSDFEPAWSPDGEHIVFVSDRKNYISPESVENDFKMQHFDFGQTNIYMVDRDGSNMVRLTDTEYNEDHPIWANTKNLIFFTSDRAGIWNIYVKDLNTGEEFPITNVLTGIFQLSISRDDSKLAFSSYSQGGWDIYLLKNPLEIEKGSVELKPTKFFVDLGKTKENRKSREKRETRSKKLALKESDKYVVEPSPSEDYTHYIFAKGYLKDSLQVREERKEAVLPDSIVFKDTLGKYKI